ncbi:hypothetical protein CHS0354_035865 [Potamilus streckersoni]|uniref:GOLD domain-containing protein n=1 Tax=Potamilus streckersoni TaxID=2493646 RepID=A0AAE0SX21_9BIVA|nr:hypothetical protein CHS0354_035865 [Potamilus streckersoni]
MAKLTITCCFQCLICFLQFKSLYTEIVLGEETGEFDFDGLPGVRYEFGFKVLPRTEECFYQTVRKGSHLQVLYKILRGGGLNVHVYLIDPSQTIVESMVDAPVGNFETVVPETGDYSICIDNTISQFTSKFVNIYLETYFTSDWEKFAEELDNIHVAVSNFTFSWKDI